MPLEKEWQMVVVVTGVPLLSLATVAAMVMGIIVTGVLNLHRMDDSWQVCCHPPVDPYQLLTTADATTTTTTTTTAAFNYQKQHQQHRQPHHCQQQHCHSISNSCSLSTLCTTKSTPLP